MADTFEERSTPLVAPLLGAMCQIVVAPEGGTA
jgi:hypothetical protein